MSESSISDPDIRALIGVLATLAGKLQASHRDSLEVEDYAKRLVTTGLLDRDVHAEPPSLGEVVLALEDLVQRLRYARGEYDRRPDPLPKFMTHVLSFPSEEAANSCLEALPRGQVRGAEIRDLGGDGWSLVVSYAELPPDESFHEREATLRQEAAAHGGRYRGSQR